jgi:hypothetical protein
MRARIVIEVEFDQSGKCDDPAKEWAETIQSTMHSIVDAPQFQLTATSMDIIEHDLIDQKEKNNGD